MTHRAIQYATWGSVIAWCATMMLTIASHWLNPRDHRISLRSDLHVGIGNTPGPLLVIFNDPVHGPYYGSIVGLTDSDGNLHPRDLKCTGFTSILGIYYRHFLWADSGTTLWTLMLSLFTPLVLFAILPTIAIVRILRRKSLPHQLSGAS